MKVCSCTVLCELLYDKCCVMFLEHILCIKTHKYLEQHTENADFTDAYIGNFDIKNLCKNPTLKVRDKK